MTRSLTSWVTLRWFLALGVTVMATKALAAKAKRTRDQQSEGHGEGSDHAPARLPLGERYRRLAAFGKVSFVTKQGIEKLMASVLEQSRRLRASSPPTSPKFGSAV